jgi:hypothetical protein
LTVFNLLPSYRQHWDDEVERKRRKQCCVQDHEDNEGRNGDPLRKSVALLKLRRAVLLVLLVLRGELGSGGSDNVAGRGAGRGNSLLSRLVDSVEEASFLERVVLRPDHRADVGDDATATGGKGQKRVDYSENGKDEGVRHSDGQNVAAQHRIVLKGCL